MNAHAAPLPPDRNHASERRVGEIWERYFCELAAQYEKSFTQQQLGRTGSAQWMQHGIHPLLLPDFVIWTAPGEHHEIKHKAPTNPGQLWRCFGLEKYRLEALLAFRRETKQPVLYTIHNWELAGARSSQDETPNQIDHWLTVDVRVLDAYVRERRIEAPPVPTWVNGVMQTRPCYFWPTSLWRPLGSWWDDDEIPF